MKNDGLKVLKAEITNFKNIDYREVEFNGRSVIIAGPNQAGKSSLIQAICSPLNSKYIPLEPIKEGEEKGKVELTIGGKLDGEDVTYSIEYFFTQGNKRGRLALFDEEGTQIKGGEKGILNSIIGDISFDIMEFVSLGRTKTGAKSVEGVRKQIEILKSIMPKDAIKKIHELDTEKQEKYDLRHSVNLEVKFLKSKLDQSAFTQEEIDKYSEVLSVKDLMEEIQKAQEKNGIYDKSEEIVDSYEDNCKELDEEIAELEVKLKKRKAEREHLDVQKAKCEAWMKKNPKKDISDLQEKIDNIQEHNSNVAKVQDYEKSRKELDEKSKESDNLTERLKAIEEEKKAVFSNAKMPVKGLEFDEDNVTFRGLPLSEGNIPTSQLIGVGLKIGMAMNPNLKLLVIRDGSLLDQKTMNFILDVCEKKGYQLLIEVVKHEGGDLSVEFIEK